MSSNESLANLLKEERRFEQAIAGFRAAARDQGPSGPIASALAQAYEQVTYQTLADQVRRTVVHEVAHHFGIDDDRLTELGW